MKTYIHVHCITYHMKYMNMKYEMNFLKFIFLPFDLGSFKFGKFQFKLLYLVLFIYSLIYESSGSSSTSPNIVAGPPHSTGTCGIDRLYLFVKTLLKLFSTKLA